MIKTNTLIRYLGTGTYRFVGDSPDSSDTSHSVFKGRKRETCAWLYVCGVCVCGVIGRKPYAIDKLWRKKPSVLSSDLQLEAQSKARIKQHRGVQSTP